MNDVCKWLADEVCVNAGSPYCADFCPSINNPHCCVYFEEDMNGSREAESNS